MPTDDGAGAADPAGAPATRVLLVDDQEMVARGLGAALGAEAALDVVGVASSSEEALDLAAASSPNVAVVDLQLGEADGLDAARRIRAARPDVAVVLLADGPDDSTLRRALGAGCSGLVAKRGRLDELVIAIRAAASGSTAFPQALMAGVLQDRPGAPALSARELQVLRLVAAGEATRDIAARLGLSVHTARNHIRNLMTKLGAHSRVEAVVMAARTGLIELPHGREAH
jgi:DNA-binding NarL/FixJ family response regulator